ncbi:MAG: hypothetical protein GX556_02120 [Fibrobacter sp.]|nr:hypothetical protein [Fibrobacter sp.]
MKLWPVFLFLALCVQIVSSQTVIAVTQLKSSGLSTEEAQSLTDALRSELGTKKQFRVMERAMMEEILREQGFQQSGTCDEASCAVTMGRILSVQHIVMGNIGKVGKTYTMSVRLVDVATGSILKDVTEYHKGAVDALLTQFVPVVCQKLARFNESEEKPVVKNKKNRKKPVIITALAGAGLAAIAVPVILFSLKDNNESSNPDTKDLNIKW